MKINTKTFRPFEFKKEIFLNLGPEDDAATAALEEELIHEGQGTGGEMETQTIEEAKKLAEQKGQKVQDVVAKITQKEVKAAEPNEEEKRMKEKSDERVKACLTILEAKTPTPTITELIDVAYGRSQLFSSVEDVTLEEQKTAFIHFLNEMIVRQKAEGMIQNNNEEVSFSKLETGLEETSGSELLSVSLIIPNFISNQGKMERDYKMMQRSDGKIIIYSGDLKDLPSKTLIDNKVDSLPKGVIQMEQWSRIPATKI